MGSIRKYFSDPDTVLWLEDGTEFWGQRFGSVATGFGLSSIWK
jgi:hypothetical protein